MSEIEWQESRILEPEIISIEVFAKTNGLDGNKIIPKGIDLIVLVEHSALEDLSVFFEDDLQREHGGVLIGKPFFDPGRQQSFVVVKKALPAFGTEGSPVHMQFTSQAWGYISSFIEDYYPEMAVVGWCHSHPGLGVFMSATDRATQSAFFSHPWSLAVVVDPVAKETGWFSGEDCQQLDHEHVVPYNPTGNQYALNHASQSDVEMEYYHSIRKNLSWLLPSSLLFVFLFFFLYSLYKSRFTTL